MECNKDEARRAKSIADRKLEQKDYFGAKKFALKAQSLYPGLDGISQMLTTLDVYLSAENKISGEADWYGVLGVNPLADDETIKKQYRKLALMLHPDKNSSIGADGAFKLISEAWSLLSDKAKRLVYNQRRGHKGFQQNVRTHTGGPSAPSGPSQYKVPTHTRGPSAPSRRSQQKIPKHTCGPSAPSRHSQQKGPAHTCGQSPPSIPIQFSNCASRQTSASMPQNQSAMVPSKPTPAPSHQRTDTFWTTCRQCNTQYEYLRIYRNRTLLCCNCQKPFMASETAPPVKILKSAAGQNAYYSGRNAATLKSGDGQAGQGSFRHGNSHQGPLPGIADIGSREPSIASKVANDVQIQDQLKRPHIEPYASADFEGCFKKIKLGNDSGSVARGHSGLGTASASGPRSSGFSNAYYEPDSTRELTPRETRMLLMVKAQKDIVETLSDSGAGKEKYKTEESNEEKYGFNRNIHEHDGIKKNDFSARISEQSEKHQGISCADNIRKEHLKAVTIDVPDSDFHDFDVDRSESSFSDNEIWAAYDANDGMPRLYALISKVVSRDPFKLRISWLNSKTNSECSDIDWVGSGFYRTCGEFRVSRYEICTSINAFCQRINWSKSPHGIIIILPQKGDFWALYRNWSWDWNENTPVEVVHRYDMVMVLDDYSEERGVSVAPLVKVAGFRTIFLPNLNPAAIQRIPKEEMFRFSHRVPNHFLSRNEAPDAPEGSVELDPAATPHELLQMITETGEV